MVIIKVLTTGILCYKNTKFDAINLRQQGKNINNNNSNK